MKLDIRLISLSLFWWFPVYLDLDTGRTYNVKLHAAEIDKLKNKRRIPRYSQIPIYQRYLDMVKERLNLELGSWFDKYPKFEFIPEYEPEEYLAFIKEAGPVVESFFDPSIPSFSKYADAFMIQFAKEWCEKEGYEWYEK